MAYSIGHLGGTPVTISYEELVASIAAAGWPESEWATAAAVAGAESSRHINIYNTYLQGHYGLFQISKSAHPDYFKSLPNGNGWVEPVGNAAYAYKLYQGRGNRYDDWAAYTSGAFAVNLPAAQLAVAQVQSQLRKGVPLPGSDPAKNFGPYTRQQVLMSYLYNGSNSVGARVGKLQMAAAVGSVADSLSAAGTATGQATAASGAAVASAVNYTSGFWNAVSGLWTALTTPALWMRIAYGTTGVVLIAGGLFLIVRNTTVTSVTKGIVK